MKKKHKQRLAILERIVVEQSARIARLEERAGIQSDAPMAGSFVLSEGIGGQLRAAVASMGRVKVDVGEFEGLGKALERAGAKVTRP